MRSLYYAYTILLVVALAACETGDTPPGDGSTDAELTWQTVQDSTHRVTVVGGFSRPEAVRYDPDQDVYFVANFNGDVAADSNGFISRVMPEGTIDQLEFMVGTEEYPLHAPRGMYIVGDTLWAADADGLHGFDRASGEHLAFVDFRTFEPGFLNDVTAGPDGALYVTDTGQSRVYRMQGGEATIVVEDSLLGAPNGITWDAEAERMVFAPWESQTIRAWQPGADGLEDVGTSTGGNFDGIEVVDGRFLIASQTDSTLYVMEDGVGRPLIELPARPADIGIDTQRMRVAVPYVAANRVDIWPLPQN